MPWAEIVESLSCNLLAASSDTSSTVPTDQFPSMSFDLRYMACIFMPIEIWGLTAFPLHPGMVYTTSLVWWTRKIAQTIESSAPVRAPWSRHERAIMVATRQILVEPTDLFHDPCSCGAVCVIWWWLYDSTKLTKTLHIANLPLEWIYENTCYCWPNLSSMVPLTFWISWRWSHDADQRGACCCRLAPFIGELSKKAINPMCPSHTHPLEIFTIHTINTDHWRVGLRDDFWIIVQPIVCFDHSQIYKSEPNN